MMPVWMTDRDLDPYIELRLKHWAVNSPHDLDYWRELLTDEHDEEAWLRIGGGFLAELGIIVEKVRDTGDELEWLVWKLPYGC
jgi:hypothetical protein